MIGTWAASYAIGPGSNLRIVLGGIRLPSVSEDLLLCKKSVRI